jgi:NADPH:quinone reductase-like Zn-dependent oxidoreductase
MTRAYRQWTFAKPMVDDVLGLEQFELRELPIPELKPGQALIHVRWISILARVGAWRNGLTIESP